MLHSAAAIQPIHRLCPRAAHVLPCCLPTLAVPAICSFCCATQICHITGERAEMCGKYHHSSFHASACACSSAAAWPVLQKSKRAPPQCRKVHASSPTNVLANSLKPLQRVSQRRRCPHSHAPQLQHQQSRNRCTQSSYITHQHGRHETALQSTPGPGPCSRKIIRFASRSLLVIRHQPEVCRQQVYLYMMPADFYVLYFYTWVCPSHCTFSIPHSEAL